MFFSVITKNLNWEMLLKNLVTFKKLDGIKDEKFYYYWGSLKNMILKEGSQKPICLKKEAWTVCRFKKGLGRKEGFGVFHGGLIPQCTL